MKRTFFAPEYHQISQMDCGVGALCSFFRGYGIDASYERLREACQTSVDGTSIEALEQLALDVGIDVVQHLLPPDLVIDGLEGRWPTIAVVSQPGQPPHFITLWRKVGSSWLHVMDPAQGRTWLRRAEFERSLYSTTVVFGADWADWFVLSSYRDALRTSAQRLLTGARVKQVWATLDDPQSSTELAATDAALRLVARSHATAPGKGAAWRTTLFDSALAAALADRSSLPASVWAMEALPDGLRVTSGVVLAADQQKWEPAKTGGESTADPKSLAAESVLQRKGEQHWNVWRDLYDMLSRQGRLILVASVVATAVAATAGACEILVARAASFDAARTFPVASSRLGVAGFVVALFALLTLLEGSLAMAARSIGRELEVRLRTMTFLLLPRVDDTFVRSRPTGDLAYRAHGLELGRAFPWLVFGTMRSLLDLVFTLWALTWIHASHLPILLAGAAVLVLLTQAVQNRFREVDTRFQAHGARLVTLFLDALRGFRPVRLHGYQPAFRAEQDGELILWKETGLMQARTRAGVGAIQSLLTTLWVGAIFWNEIIHDHDARSFVIVAFWALRLPGTVRTLLAQAQSYAPSRAAFARLLEIVRYAREEDDEEEENIPPPVAAWSMPPPASAPSPVADGFEDTGVTQVSPVAQVTQVTQITRLPNLPSIANVTNLRSMGGLTSGPASMRAPASMHPPPSVRAPASVTGVTSVTMSGAPLSMRIPGLSIELDDVSVVVGGNTLLREVSLQVPSGQHVAIVGASGSGKSTLVSMLLGFYPLASGQVRIDGRELTPKVAREIRLQAAWVDPAIHIWNGSFLENLEYAAAGFRHRDLLSTLEASDLLSVLDGMDRGLDTPVGGEGRLLSGGEGQRLRLGRALLRRDVRLAVFDEAFRGLDRITRKRLTLRARLTLQNATMLFVSHDISHALDFDRVLVVDDGKVVEDGHPLELSVTDSRFRTLIEAERSILAETWAPRHWRRLRVGGGHLVEEENA